MWTSASSRGSRLDPQPGTGAHRKTGNVGSQRGGTEGDRGLTVEYGRLAHSGREHAAFSIALHALDSSSSTNSETKSGFVPEISSRLLSTDSLTACQISSMTSLAVPSVRH